MSDQPHSRDRVLIGVVGRAHGVRGLVRLHSYAEDPETLSSHPLSDDQGRSWSVVWRADGLAELRDGTGRKLADRTEAERLTNLRLYVARAALPPPDEDEFFLADLVGLSAVDAAGTLCGRVTQVHDYGAGTSLEIEQSGKPALLVPFTRLCVPTVDVAAGRVIIVPPHETEAPG